MVFDVLRKRFAFVETFLQFSVSDVTGNDDLAGQRDACRNRMFRQFSANLFHRLIQVDLNGFAFFHMSEFFRNQFSRVVVKFLDPKTFAVDLALNVSVSRAADANADRAAGTVSWQTNDADVVGKVLAAELGA